MKYHALKRERERENCVLWPDLGQLSKISARAEIHIDPARDHHYTLLLTCATGTQPAIEPRPHAEVLDTFRS